MGKNKKNKSKNHTDVKNDKNKVETKTLNEREPSDETQETQTGDKIDMKASNSESLDWSESVDDDIDVEVSNSGKTNNDWNQDQRGEGNWRKARMTEERKEFSNSRQPNVNRNYRKDNSSNYSRKSEPYKTIKTSEDGRREKKRYSEISSRENSATRRDCRFDREDPEFREYREEFRSNSWNFKYAKTKEITANLFTMPDDYSLAHCVAEDMNMGAGIAVQFRRDFRRVDELLNQRQKTGGLAILEHDGRYIYYLVTKQFSFGKPTYATLFSSLKKLRSHIVKNHVKKMAIPRIGCGLDRLEWDNVKFMIEFLFREVDIEIVVCNLEPTNTDDSPQQKHKNCKVINETYPLKDIESGTVVLYFSSEDEFVTEEMKSLSEKFLFLNEFKYARKTLGSVIFFTKNQDYLLCGCIVRKRKTDPFDFCAFQKCLNSIQKENRKTKFYYYAFQAFKDLDDCLNYKIINVLRNTLRDIDVYVCWPKELYPEIGPKDQLGQRSDQDFGKKTSFGRSDSFSRNKSGDQNWRSEKNDSENFWGGGEPITAHEEQPSTSGIEDSFEEKEEPQPIIQNDDHWTGDFQAQNVANVSMTSEERMDDEYTNFEKQLSDNAIKCTLIKEQEKTNLTTAHSRVCYAREDFIMESGIAPGPKIRPEQFGKLLNQNIKEGGFAFLKENGNYLYFLITNKPNVSPTPSNIFSSIQKLRDHVRQNRVKKLIVPKMEDKTPEWQKVTFMFQFLFQKINTEIILAPLEALYNYSSITKRNNIKILHTRAGVHQMKKKSVILYLASTDGFFTEEMNSLKRKFRDFEAEFSEKRKKKSTGDILTYKESEEHVVHGCFVKNKHSDLIDFEALQKCASLVNERNVEKEKLQVVGLQAVNTEDESINYKITAVLLNNLENVTLQMCWPGVLKEKMPPKSL